jgi:hypothetical protein
MYLQQFGKVLFVPTRWCCSKKSFPRRRRRLISGASTKMGAEVKQPEKEKVWLEN